MLFGNTKIPSRSVRRAKTPPDVDSVRVFAGAVGYIPAEVDVRADGTFEHAFFPGMHVISAHAVGPDGTTWRLRSAVSDGVDLFERGMDFRPESMSYTDVELTLAASGARLIGTVWSAPGVPASDTWVVVFPAERAAWGPGLFHVATARPDTDGRYRVDVTPSDYLVALSDALDLSDEGRAAFLESLAPQSRAVTLTAGEPATLELRRPRDPVESRPCGRPVSGKRCLATSASSRPRRSGAMRKKALTHSTSRPSSRSPSA